MFRLCIDPGLHSPGVALFVDKTLRLTYRPTPERSIGDSIGARCLDIADQIVHWFVMSIGGGAKVPVGSVELVFEWPQHYDSRKGKSKGNPNNLTPLAGIGMAVAGMLCQIKTDPVTPMPAEWIGQLPKKCVLCDQTPGKKSCKLCKGSAWKTPRGSLIRSLLTSSELQLVPDQNDVIDAVGIGLWRVGRLQLRSQFPGLVTG